MANLEKNNPLAPEQGSPRRRRRAPRGGQNAAAQNNREGGEKKPAQKRPAKSAPRQSKPAEGGRPPKSPTRQPPSPERPAGKQSRRQAPPPPENRARYERAVEELRTHDANGRAGRGRRPAADEDPGLELIARRPPKQKFANFEAYIAAHGGATAPIPGEDAPPADPE